LKKPALKKPSKWYRLDNAAKLYPAIKSRKWASIFRLSVTLKEVVRPDILQKALEDVAPRFPSMCLTLRRGVFWYYLEHNSNTPLIHKDAANPCIPIKPKLNRGFLFRVRYHNRRIAVELFHSLSDGTGGIVFLKTLTAQYLRLAGHDIPATYGILDLSLLPDPEELEDSFTLFKDKKVRRTWRENKAYHIDGTPEEPNRLNIITGVISLQALLEKARELKVSITELLCAVYIYAVYRLQKAENPRLQLPVKISVPINLRKFYNTKSLRNFSTYVNPGIDPALGDYTFEETLCQVHHFMRYEVNEKLLAARVNNNVQKELNLALRLAPLFIKNIAVLATFNLVGEKMFTGTISNLGSVEVPPEMEPLIDRFDFLLGPPKYNKTACAVISFGKKLTINFSRTIEEPFVERLFFTQLVRMGIKVRIESNQE
jgi:NRPS condensation-like uncharacterized protein